MKEEKIRLLDRSLWDKQELLEKMQDDSFYYGHLGKYCLSSSSIKKLLISPMSYYESVTGKENSNQVNLDIGWLFHLAILEPHLYESQVVVDVQDRKTKKYKEAVEKYKDHDVRVFTKKEVGIVQKMGMSFHNNSRAKSLLDKTEKEVPTIGNLFGVPFRAKADALGSDYIIDLKSTSDIDRFYWEAKRFRYDIQCYIYCELFGIPKDNFTFIAIDKRDGRLGLYKVSDKSYENAMEDCRMAIQRFNKYFIEKQAEVYDFCLEGMI